MGLITTTVLSAYTAMPNPSAQLYANPSKEAFRHLGKAVYIELDLGATAKYLEKHYIPKWIIRNGSLVATTVTIVGEKRFTYTWTF